MRNLISGLIIFFATCQCMTHLHAQDVDWASDLDYLATTLAKKHPDLFHRISKEDFTNAKEATATRIAGMERTQASLELMKLVAMIGDGHTSVVPEFDSFSFFPINVKWFEDGIFVRAIDQRHKDLIGARLIAVGEVSAKDIVERFAEIIAHDNQWGVVKVIDKQFQTAEFLRYAGAIDDDGQATFRFEKDGKETSLVLKSIKAKNANRIRFANAYSVGLMKPSIFLDLLIKDEKRMPFWNEWISDFNTVYFKYNECRNPEGFKDLVEGTANFIAKNNVKKFVLDIRDNAGGSSLVFKPLFEYLVKHKELNKKGKLFVIVGRNTFSSGIFAACDMQKTNAIFVGEPTGGRPNHFGEVKSFQLPSSGLTVLHSTKTFRLVDEDKASFEPDVVIRYRAQDVFAAKDQALQAIFDYRK